MWVVINDIDLISSIKSINHPYTLWMIGYIKLSDWNHYNSLYSLTYHVYIYDTQFYKVWYPKSKHLLLRISLAVERMTVNHDVAGSNPVFSVSNCLILHPWGEKDEQILFIVDSRE